MKEKIKVIFFGNPKFGIPTLEALREKHELLGVVTDPEKTLRVRKKEILQKSPVHLWALSNGVPVVEYTGDPEPIRALGEASLGIVIGFKYLPKEIYSIPTYGSINLHTSLLPDYRGAAPIEWAIVNGESKTGMTAFRISEGLDTGDILGTSEVPIFPEDTSETLRETLEISSSILTLKILDEGLYMNPGIPQTRGSGKKAPKITRDLCRISWEKSSQEVYNHIRGFYPRSWTTGDGLEIKILEVLRWSKGNPREPGEIVYLGKSSMAISCGDGWISVKTLQISGKTPINVDKFINGYKGKITTLC